MQSEKTVALTFRVRPETKRRLGSAEKHQRRSPTHMFEGLVEDFFAGTANPDEASSISRQAPTGGEG